MQKMNTVHLSQEQDCLMFVSFSFVMQYVNTPNKLEAGVSLPCTVEQGSGAPACCWTRYIVFDKSIVLSALTRSRTEVQIYALRVKL